MDKKKIKSNLKINSEYLPGDVVWTDNVNFAHDDKGNPVYNNTKDYKKKRPVIIVSKDNESQITYMGVFGTSDVNAVDQNDVYTIKLPPSQQTGLTKETYFDITQMQPIHIECISNKSGELSKENLEYIQYLMLKYLGLISDEEETENQK
ncbi:type II toxin-antitoxin system PemK/MazF family toxin [Thermosipho globiformans]|uniref:type II toxin-antitoxin system PemK/MazF family toxin n=1 Tax=Thermosipho globiformans TaxID=380685 RepID=UPI000F8E9A9D|nr:type II toxin-antitoxin system PemK/MazF family toxin [Thermosipho globiformans]